MLSSKEIIAKTEKYSAHNYRPKEVVIVKGEGAVVTDPEGKKYFDMLSAYSALNFGHCHPEIVQACKEQLDKVTLTSRAFHNNILCEFCEKLASLTGKEMILPMNTGAEAVETSLKTSRRWGAFIKGVPDGMQEIICCSNNFHGRTISIITMSTDNTARRGFGPFTNGFKVVEYGNSEALEKAITPNTVGFLVEPIQGEAGIIIPPKGYLKQVREICDKHNILMIADEVQTGFARTGKLFACNHENVVPDIYVLGKALGGGIMPVSAIAANKNILEIYEPGSHGSTFGGNPLACAVAIKALEILIRDNYALMAEEKGKYFIEKLRKIKNDEIVDVRGKGLLIGLEFSQDAAPYVKKLIDNGVLCKETHEKTIRFAPPISITQKELDTAIDIIVKTLTK